MDKIPQIQNEEENFKLTPAQENERDEMQELVNIMRAYLKVDQNGALIGIKDINGKPVYPTKEQYEETLEEIKKLKQLSGQKKINEKLISNFHKLILLGGEKIIELLATDFKKSKIELENRLKEMVKKDSILELEKLDNEGKDYGKEEINRYKTLLAEAAEEAEEKKYGSS